MKLSTFLSALTVAMAITGNNLVVSVTKDTRYEMIG